MTVKEYENKLKVTVFGLGDESEVGNTGDDGTVEGVWLIDDDILGGSDGMDDEIVLG